MRRAVKLYDRLVIGIARNEDKRPLFSLDERVEMALDLTREYTGETVIEVKPFSGLLMHFAQKSGRGRSSGGCAPYRTSSMSSRWSA